MARSRHPGIFIPPMAVGVILVVLSVLHAAGANLPWLQVGGFVAGLAILAFAFLDILVRDIRHTHLHPIGMRAIVLGIMVLEVLALFSVTYLAIASYPGQMNGLTTPLDALYFTMTTLMTIGFGDISAESQLARGTVLIQMFFSVVVLTASVRLLSSLTRGVTREVGHHGEAQGR
jgi:voltage-gated potassium channel